MIGRGDADHVDVLVGKHVAKIAVGLRLVLAVADGPIEIALVHIADRDGHERVLHHGIAQVRAAHFAHADERGVDLVVRALDSAREDIGGEGGGAGVLKEVPTICGHAVIISPSIVPQ